MVKVGNTITKWLTVVTGEGIWLTVVTGEDIWLRLVTPLQSV